MSDWDAIAASTPINRTAAVVVGQKRIGAGLSPELERRTNLVRLVQQIDRAIQATKDPERKKALGVRKFEVQNALKSLPRKQPRGRDVGEFIIEVVQERMTKAAYKSVVDEAHRRFAAHEKRAAEQDKAA